MRVFTLFTCILLINDAGQTLREIFILRESMFDRIPDIVVWPSE